MVDILPSHISNREGATAAGSGWCHQRLGYKKGMAIASLNINGLHSHLDELRMIIKELGIHILARNTVRSGISKRVA